MQTISIIMSAYKPSAPDLEITIQSVLNQTHTNFEFIIIKDDELSETLELLKSWEQIDARIHIIDNEVNIGLIASLNKGLDIAEASLIARIDVGDWWEPQKLQRQAELFEADPELYLCGTSIELVDEQYNLLGHYTYPKSHNEIVSWLLKAKNPFAHPSAMFRKSSLRYNPNALYCEDLEMWYRYSRLGKLVNIDEPLTHYVIDTTSITNSKRSLIIENVTKVYCTFLNALRNNDFTFIHNGLNITPASTLSFANILSNQWYSKATIASFKHQNIKKIYYFSLSIIFNPRLILNKLQRMYCKILGNVKV
ncbi:MAG: glycosyltransferase [Sulfuricurvum sp.]|nr:glycosyltransferase [Sulfuricurvum sp.]